MKNLVLSGVGHIYVVDDKITNEQDIKENFFVDKNDILNKIPRGQAVLLKILELNEDCHGEFINCSTKNFLKNESINLNTYDIILSSNNSFVKNIFIYLKKYI